MIEFRIDRRAGVAAYMQIVQQARQAVLLGRLVVGDQLPTAREVVAATGINPNTVLRAYRQLDAEGIVETRPGSGTFVTSAPAQGISVGRPELAASLTAWCTDARQAGLTTAEALALAATTIETVFQEQEMTEQP